MKYCVVLILFFCFACTKKVYQNNGESIYKTGKNLKGEKILDKEKSQLKIFKSCKACHGLNGKAMRNVSITYKSLTDPNKFVVPYTDSLIFRFLDHDLKSDGNKANIGVIWKLSDADKTDLVNYLKTL